MNSVNAILMKFFKLPPGLQALFVLMGFGGLGSLLYFLAPALATRQGKMWIMIAVGIGLAIFGVVWLVRRFMFGRRSAALGSALEGQGPSRGDIAEQERIYREKFRGKLSELKKVGLSVYKLPWFVLMGEPGCGKTASLIHSGLDFPLGKDEVAGFGGTRNYNWWFTNEAVILDTAGRIAFQEEGTTDRSEWEYFLRLLKSNRPRCPINGVVVALPADKLLKETSEERANKAAILRERLRQIHQTLGVRFPTFIVVSKMDLVGGFSEFFEEIRVDLQQRNQMFGWSRPGAFESPFDTGSFDKAFEGVYLRLRDWEMRYLQRKATDQELGMIVTFPEAFRELGKPLNDYIGTIFQKSPLLEPPFFRGFYFTSAVQEGAPIFDVLMKGRAALASTHERATKAVDSKAFFIHDLYARKVFPEQGLVFRSAKHVAASQRTRTLATLGAVVLVAAFATFFAVGAFKTRDLLITPRVNCATAAEQINSKDKPAEFAQLADSLKMAAELNGHVEAYDRPLAGFYARLLFLGADINTPRGYVQHVHARYVLHSLLRPVLQESVRKLAETDPATLNDNAARERYFEALATATRWFGELAGKQNLTALSSAEVSARVADFDKLLAISGAGAAAPAEVSAQLKAALNSLAGTGRSFAGELLDGTLKIDVPATAQQLAKAIGRYKEYWKPYTQLQGDRANESLRYWVEFVETIGRMQAGYRGLLAMEPGFQQCVDEGKRGERGVQQRFKDTTDTYAAKAGPVNELDPRGDARPAKVENFVHAYQALSAFLGARPVPSKDGKILRTADIREQIARQWGAYFKRLADELGRGSPRAASPAATPAGVVYRAIDDADGELGGLLDAQVAEARKRLVGLPEGRDPLDYYVEQEIVAFDEAPVRNPPTVRVHDNSLGKDKLLKSYLEEIGSNARGLGATAESLKLLKNWPGLLAQASAAASSGQMLARIEQAVDEAGAKAVLSPTQRAELIRRELRLQEFWEPVGLFDLSRTVSAAQKLTGRSLLLKQMEEVLAATYADAAAPRPGLARLMERYDEADRERLPFDRGSTPRAATSKPAAPATPAPAPTPAPATTPAKPDDDEFSRPSAGARKQDGRVNNEPAAPSAAPATPTAAAASSEPPSADDSDAILRRYHTRALLTETLRQRYRVREALKKLPGSDSVIAGLDSAARAYIRGYFADWKRLYETPADFFGAETLDLVRRLDAGMDWAAFHAEMERNGAGLSQRTAARLDAVVREVAVFHYDLDRQKPEDDEALTLIRDEYKAPGSEWLAEKLAPQRTALRNSRDKSESVHAATMKEVFDAYLTGVREMGADLRGIKPLPTARVRSEILFDKSPAAAEFMPVAPLIDIAEYGEALLRHEFSKKLSTLFANRVGRYPFSTGGAPVSAEEFLQFLRDVDAFEQKYGELHKSLFPKEDDPSRQVYAQARRWVEFLYKGDIAALRDKSALPPTIAINVGVVQAEGAVNISNIYNKLTLTLPLLEAGGQRPADEIIFDIGITPLLTMSAFSQSADRRKFEWSLHRPGVSYRPSKVVASERNERAPDQPATKEQALPGEGAWAILTQIKNEAGARTGQLQFRMPRGTGDTYGFDVGIEFDRPLPGTITPYAGATEPPRLARAREILR
jgi:IcmF-related N-terminal domain